MENKQLKKKLSDDFDQKITKLRLKFYSDVDKEWHKYQDALAKLKEKK